MTSAKRHIAMKRKLNAMFASAARRTSHASNYAQLTCERCIVLIITVQNINTTCCVLTPMQKSFSNTVDHFICHFPESSLPFVCVTSLHSSTTLVSTTQKQSVKLMLFTSSESRGRNSELQPRGKYLGYLAVITLRPCETKNTFLLIRFHEEVSLKCKHIWIFDTSNTFCI